MKKKNYFTVIVITLALIYLVVGLFYYVDFMNKKLTEQNEATLEEIMHQQIFNFDLKLNNDKKTIVNFAKLIAKYPYDQSFIQQTLSEIVADSDFEYLGYSDVNGKAFNNKGDSVDISDRDYFLRAVNGETVVSDPVFSKLRNTNIIVVSTPVYRDGKISGTLSGTYKVEALESLLLPSFGNSSYSYVTTNSGEIVVERPNTYTLSFGKNLLDDWKNAAFLKYDTLSTIQKNIIADQGGKAVYVLNGSKRCMHYSTIEVNKWNLFTIVPDETLEKFSGKIISSSFVMILCVAIVAVVFVLLQMVSQKRHLREIEKIAFTDDLTGAPTLAKFKLEAQKFIDSNPNKKLLMVKLDIDKFKLVNRILGFSGGDVVIINMCKALKANTPGKYERFARIHDDEFIVLYEYEKQEEILEITNWFQKNFNELMGEDFQYNVKIISGHYLMQMENCKDVSEAIEKANIAHRKAKQTGQELCVYDELMIKQELLQKQIENRMALALENNEFKVFLQPKYYLSDETIAGAEALVRWQDTESGKSVVYPNEFIPLFEENGFILKLDVYMFEKVCGIIKGWIDNGITPIVVSVNFSRRHLENVNLVDMLCKIADKYAIPRHLLEIELTESTIFDNEEILQNVLEKLHNAGFTLSMDDFGSGYSSLGLLKNLPVDVIKIDRRFFVDSKDEKRANIVIANVIKMAKELSIHTVAEGVETLENIELLRSLGCDIVQGYYYAKPMPAEDLTSSLSKSNKGEQNG